MGTVILVVAGGGLAGLFFWLATDRCDDYAYVLVPTGFLMAITSIICALVIPFMVLGTIGDVNKFTVFYDSNASVYQEVVDLAAAGVDSSDNNANLAQVIAYQEALGAKRDAIVEYNQDMKRQLYWQDHPMTNILWKNVPERLKYL